MKIEKLGSEKTFAITYEGKNYTVIQRIHVVGGMEVPEEWEVLNEDGDNLAIQPNKKDMELVAKIINAVKKFEAKR